MVPVGTVTVVVIHLKKKRKNQHLLKTTDCWRAPIISNSVSSSSAPGDKNNAFSYQLRNYLQGTRDIGSVKGMDTAEKVFDAINVKKLLKPNQIQKILDLDTGGKGVSLTSKRAKTFGNLKFTMETNRFI